MIPKAYDKFAMGTADIPTTQITFFYIEGILHCEFIPKGQTVNQAYYEEKLKLCTEKGLNLGPAIAFSTMTVSQLTRRCQAVSGPKINY
jgi:hypothetical protein